MSQLLVNVGWFRTECVIMWDNKVGSGLVEAAGSELGSQAGVEEERPQSQCQGLQGHFPGCKTTALIAGRLFEYQGMALTHCLSSSLSPHVSYSLLPSFHVAFRFLALSKSLDAFTSTSTWWWVVQGAALWSYYDWIEVDPLILTAFCLVGWIVASP